MGTRQQWQTWDSDGLRSRERERERTAKRSDNSSMHPGSSSSSSSASASDTFHISYIVYTYDRRPRGERERERARLLSRETVRERAEETGARMLLAFSSFPIQSVLESHTTVFSLNARAFGAE